MGCDCGPCRSKRAPAPARGGPRLLRGLGDPPPADAWRWRVENARTVADLVPILAGTLYDITKLQTEVRDTYVGGKHSDEAALANRKRQLAQYLIRVRDRLAAVERRIGDMTGDEPIPPDVYPLIRQVAGYTDPLPDAYAPRVARAQLDQLVRDAAGVIGGNLPKIPHPGSPTGVWGSGVQWAGLVVVLVGLWALSRTSFEVQV